MAYEVNLNNKGGLAEIYQSVDIHFAFCEVSDKDGKTVVSQTHPWIQCRDFLGDALVATAVGINYGIYGFGWNGKEKKVPTDLTYLLIKYPKDKLQSVLPVIHHYESAVKWRKTKLHELGIKSGNKDVMLAISSGRWVSSPQLISLYTMLWRFADIPRNEGENVDDFVERCSNAKDAKGNTTNDAQYLTQIKNAAATMKMSIHPFYVIMKHNRKVFKDCYEHNGDSNHDVHYNNGILSLVQKAEYAYLGQTLSGFSAKVGHALADVIKEKYQKEEACSAPNASEKAA